MSVCERPPPPEAKSAVAKQPRPPSLLGRTSKSAGDAIAPPRCADAELTLCRSRRPAPRPSTMPLAPPSALQLAPRALFAPFQCPFVPFQGPFVPFQCPFRALPVPFRALSVQSSSKFWREKKTLAQKRFLARKVFRGGGGGRRQGGGKWKRHLRCGIHGAHTERLICRMDPEPTAGATWTV